MPSFNDRLEHRARLLERLFAALFLALGLASACAQNFPSKPIRLIAVVRNNSIRCSGTHLRHFGAMA